VKTLAFLSRGFFVFQGFNDVFLSKNQIKSEYSGSHLDAVRVDLTP
jgi:hypothetical protein